MVKYSKKNNAMNFKKQRNSHTLQNPEKKIGADIRYEVCGSSMTTFGGLLGSIMYCSADTDHSYQSNWCNNYFERRYKSNKKSYILTCKKNQKTN